jgi:hypothetical protein
MMKYKLTLCVMLFSLTTSCFPQTSGTNTTWIVKITFSNGDFPSWVDTFGTGIGYTNCIDKMPGLPFAELEMTTDVWWGSTVALFYDDLSGDPNCLGLGAKTNIHGGSYAQAIIDTFEYEIQVADKDVPWYFTWDTTNIHRKLSSLVMQDAITGTFLNVNMMMTDSIILTISSPAKNMSQFFIFATWKPIDSSFVTGSKEGKWSNNMPEVFTLHQNYPNPFNPSTIIEYDLPSREYVTLKVYNMLGQEVAVLAEGLQEPGYKSITFEIANLPSGVYIYRLMAGTFVDTKKMLLIR